MHSCHELYFAWRNSVSIGVTSYKSIGTQSGALAMETARSGCCSYGNIDLPEPSVGFVFIMSRYELQQSECSEKKYGGSLDINVN